MSPNRPTHLEMEAMEKLRLRLIPQRLIDEKKLQNDFFLVRYLRANNLNVDKAEKMLHYYAGFLKENNVDSLFTEKFPQDFSDQFYCYLGGGDKEGRPLIVIPQGGLWNLKKAIEAGREDMFVRYVLKIGAKFEQEVLKRNVDYGYMVAELSNIAYGNYMHRRTLEVVLRLVNLLEKVSPLVIKKVYFVNAPRLWVAFFNTVRALVSVSADIYAFDSNEKKWKAALLEIMPQEGLCPELGGTCKSYETV